MTNPDVTAISWLRVVLAFSVVAALLAMLGVGLKYIAQNRIKIPGLKAMPRRLAIIESMPLDVRRRLVLLRCDDHEHLVLLGANQDIVVESNLQNRETVSLETKSLSDALD